MVRLNAIASVIFVALIYVGTSFASERLPAIGTKAHKLWFKGQEQQVCVTHSAQLDPCFEHVFEGLQYTVAYDSATNRVSYLYTEDKQFRTADGLKVGDEISVSEQTIHVWPGWQIHGPATSDGWHPVIGWDLDVKLNDGSVLDLHGKRQGESGGQATIIGFAKGRWLQ